MKHGDIYREYCTGCGLCRSEKGMEMAKDEKGFWYPKESEKNEEMKAFQNKVCPAGGYRLLKMDPKQIWGKYEGVYAAYSTDEKIRKKASSGGVLTALAVFLLENGKADGIIHVSRSEKHPFYTQCYCSTKKEEVVARCGSRYAISSPLADLKHMIQDGKTYCVIGKPCDISALRSFLEQEKTYKGQIKYLLSFFCAGMPSEEANRHLLGQLKCEEANCASLNYRGNGWPGRTTAVKKDGSTVSMDYSKAWGGILGRDIHKFCRLCMDGIGEAADISCGDGWYLGEDGEPDFGERDGRNVVFARTQKGKEIYQEAVAKGYVQSETWEDIRQLQAIQKYQYVRRGTMKARILALKWMGKPVPNYRLSVLGEYAKYVGIGLKCRIFGGTVKRIIKGKI